MVKKGFVRTLESGVAIVLTLSVVLFLSQQAEITGSQEEHNLAYLMQDNSFRNCVVSQSDCVRTKIKDQIRNKMSFNYSIDSVLEGLPDQDIFTESYFVSGNETEYLGKAIMIYYWK